MEEGPHINFKQFRSNKSNKAFLVRFSIYIILLSVLGGILYIKFNSNPKKVIPLNEIKGVKIEDSVS